MKKYYQLVAMPQSADLYIYGEITSWPWLESDVAAYPLVQEIDALDVQTINVYINSYGGEVAQALAIGSALCRNKAQIITHDDGFACSAAAYIFMAGDKRLMSKGSLLFVHRVINGAYGNSEDLHNAAEEAEIVNEASLALYKGKLNITDDELMELFRGKDGQGSWILPEDALAMGFATAIVDEEPMAQVASQNVRKLVLQKVATQSKMEAEPTTIDGIEKMMREVLTQFIKPPEKEPEPKPQTDLKQLFKGLL